MAKKRVGGASHTRTFSMSHRSSVAMGFVTGMLSASIAKGKDIAPWLVKAGINRTDLGRTDRRVSIAAYATLYDLVVAALQDEGFGLFRTPLRPGCFEFLCRSAVNNGTLEQALDRAARFLS